MSSLNVPEQQGMAGEMPATCAQARPAEDVCRVDMEGDHEAEDGKAMARDKTDVPVEELRPVMAYCCNVCSLFCGCPSCIGCTGQCTLLICLCKYTCCKLLDCKDEDKKCCACDNCNWYLAAPTKLYECTGQYFCLDVRAALPCTNKVPCLLTLCGLTCCADFKPKVGCMKKVGELIPRIAERAGKDMA